MIFPVLAFLSLVLAFVAVIGYLSWRQHPDPGAKSFALMAGGIVWWISAMVLGHLLDQVFDLHAMFVLLTRVEWAGIFVMTVSWFLFVLEYTGRGEYANRRIARMLLVFPFAVYPVAFANGLVLDAAGSMVGLPTSLTASFDPWLAVEPLVLAYLYALLGVSSLLLLVFLFTKRLPYPEVAVLWLLALVVPWAVNALYLGGQIPPLSRAQIDPTPLGFVGLAGIGFVALRRTQSFRMAPLARAYVVDNLEVGILVLNAEFQIVDANECARSLLGLEEGEIGSDVREVLGAAMADGRALERQSTEEGSFVETLDDTVFTLDSPQGPREISVEMAPLERVAGELRGSVDNYGLVLRDETSRIRRQRRLEQQAEQLEVLNQVVRHDIRNDLQVVTGYADMIADGVADEHREYVETVLENAQHAVDLTTTAGNMAEVMLSEDDLQQPVALRATLEDELEEVRSTYPDADVTVEGGVPAVEVLASDMLDSVFRNVLKNAVQHNDADVPEVAVSVRDIGDAVEVRVADNGPGVPDDLKESIFGKGEQGLDSEGTGLGLYLVKTLVEGYGGDVWVEDNDPEGAVFVVELPKDGS